MKKSLTNNIGLKLLAFLFAFMLWLLVVNIDDPVDTKTFDSIPVTIEHAEVVTQDQRSYQVLDGTDTVSVTVSATRSVLEKISAERKIAVGSTVLDFEGMTVRTGGEEIALPLKEFNLLFKLLSYPGKIFTRRQLMDEIWGMDSDTDDRTINTHINRLRDKFEDNPDFKIVTIRGLGYKAVKNDET